VLSIRVHPAQGCRPRIRHYDLAGCRLTADLDCEALAAFEVPGADPGEAPLRPVNPPFGDRPFFDAEAWIAGGDRRVSCGQDGAGGYRLEVAGIGKFQVAAEGAIRADALAPGITPEQLAETVLGPALILALALRAIYCLHAAAAANGDRAIGLLGVSGAGKSTLASRLAQLDAWRRVADDVLPVCCEAGMPFALPRFPQLKLTRADQVAAMDGRLRLAAIYVLAPPGADPEAVAVRPLDGHAAIVALARHTVASRLFAPSLLSSHLAFCVEVAARVPIRSLEFPRCEAALARVAAAIGADLRPPW
jgi:hypothetical protein